jgi:hypothetical protein
VTLFPYTTLFRSKEFTPEYILDRGDKGKVEKNAGNMIGKLYSGTPAEQQAAVTYFMGLPNVRSVTRDDNGVNVTLVDGTTKPLPFVNSATGQRMNQEDFIRSASSLLLGPQADVDRVVKSSLSTGTTVFQPGTASGAAQVTNPNEMYANYVSSNITTVPRDETQAVAQLTPIISKLGFSAREAKIGQDFVVISNRDGLESEPIDLTDSGATDAIKSFLLGNVPGEKEEDRIMFINSLSKKGVLGGGATQKGQQQQQGVGAKYNQ